jgi:hypothetical protein
VSKDYNHEIGYESLLRDFERYQKETPRGVSMTRKGQTISLQFKVGKKARSQYGCNCSFTLDGMVDALKKAKPAFLTKRAIAEPETLPHLGLNLLFTPAVKRQCVV